MARKALLKGFKRPKNISFEPSESTPDYGTFVAYPFERGYGTTVGNSLRRVLLSSIPGYAITAFRVTIYDAEGNQRMLSSEFEPIPGVMEDTPDIVNKLKRLQVALPESMDQKVLFLEFSGAQTVTGASFATEGVEVSNADLPIMTLMEDARFDVEVQIDLGRGYVPAEANEEYLDGVGTIAVDAMFSPVKRVKFSIDNARVGQRNDYDKLILDVWTDGTISPVDAVGEAAKIAKDYFDVFINFNEDEVGRDDDEDEDMKFVRQILSTPVEELELSVRASNCLKNANINTLGDLTQRTEDEIAKTRNFGKKSLQEIKEKLDEWDLGLGMTDYSALKENPIFLKKKEEQNEA
ncbi:DNA-directed RNA polymerase subunit alpha [Alkalispirochaeta alkalica]|uniref:DNA-directed RNA polymerase subunit alpha n=1 Tax=Alkalispirochaeta alkalica TaxID=46356 RepID=UPI00036991E1|nr:DNA-directed RNA polymerase subunit alpha [Alkalispirochaeta alkalica]